MVGKQQANMLAVSSSSDMIKPSKYKTAFFHTRLTMFYIRPLLYDIITVTLRLSHCFSMKCIGYKTNTTELVQLRSQIRRAPIQIVL